HVDRLGDPLPDGALLRLGTVGFRVPRIAGVGFRPTGELVVLSQNLTLHLWPAAGSGKAAVITLNEGEAAGGQAALSPDARFAAALLKRELVVWNVSGKLPSQYLSREIKDVHKLCFSPDGAVLAVASEAAQGAGTLHLCNLAEKR